jgi:hypothetical protein
MRHDPERWMAEVWADVYGFAPRKGEGWASRKVTFFLGKFRTEHDPKDGFYPVDCRNPRERRVIEFLLPILYSKKTQEAEHRNGQHSLRGAIREAACQLGTSDPRVGGEVYPPHRQETFSSLPVHPPPLPAERMCQRGGEGRLSHCGG